jgi:hypothetical protein
MKNLLVTAVALVWATSVTADDLPLRVCEIKSLHELLNTSPGMSWEEFKDYESRVSLACQIAVGSTVCGWTVDKQQIADDAALLLTEDFKVDYEKRHVNVCGDGLMDYLSGVYRAIKGN